MRVLLVDRFGHPLLVWQEDIAYQRRTAGFEAPGARECDREPLGRNRDERSPVVPEAQAAEGEGRAGEVPEASEG